MSGVASSSIAWFDKLTTNEIEPRTSFALKLLNPFVLSLSKDASSAKRCEFAFF